MDRFNVESETDITKGDQSSQNEIIFKPKRKRIQKIIIIMIVALFVVLNPSPRSFREKIQGTQKVIFRETGINLKSENIQIKRSNYLLFSVYEDDHLQTGTYLGFLQSFIRLHGPRK